MSAALGSWISTADRLPEDGASVAFVVRSTGTFEYLNGRVLGAPNEELSRPAAQEMPS